MTAVVVMLALAAAGLGCLAAGLGIRLSGVKGELGDTKLLAQANAIAAHDHELAAKQLAEELRLVRQAAGRLEQRHRAELEQIEEVAARCADASELRRMLQSLTAPEGS